MITQTQIQTAYNNGLDDAENQAVVKFSNALMGIDDGPFLNPKIEEVRQKVLASHKTDTGDSTIPEGSISLSDLSNILLNLPVSYPQTNKPVAVLVKLIKFIYGKAAKGTTGVKNYTQIVNDIKTALTND